MRSLYIACAILTAIVATIVINSFFVVNKVNDLLIICQRLESNEVGSSISDLNELLYEWDKCSGKLSLSINHSEIDRAESALFLLASYYACDDASDFLAQLETFKSALRHISSAQQFSLDNIF